MYPQKIAIIGGGIAGLAFARRYRQLGGRVSIHESRPPEPRQGLGFILLENGLRALSRVGLRSAVEALSYPLAGCAISDHHGDLLLEEDLHSVRGVTRSSFLGALNRGLPETWTRYGQVFSHFENSANGDARRAIFENGESVEADLFLGCDGSQSGVRAQIFPHAKLSRTRVCELVSVVDSNLHVARSKRRFLKIRHETGGLALGIVPADSRTLIWYLQFDADKYPTPKSDPTHMKDFARSLTRGWSGPAEQLIRATDFRRTHICPTRVLEPLDAYFRGNVALLGDAAHALHSFTSQGVNTAIEDAAVLAETLAADGAVHHHQAFLDYSKTRKIAIRPLLTYGEKLQDEFLAPSTMGPKIPLARTA